MGIQSFGGVTMKFKELADLYNYLDKKITKLDHDFDNTNDIQYMDEFNKYKVNFENLKKEDVSFQDFDLVQVLNSYNLVSSIDLPIYNVGISNLIYYAYAGVTYNKKLTLDKIQSLTFIEYSSLPLTYEFTPADLPFNFTTTQGERYELSWNYNYDALQVYIRSAVPNEKLKAGMVNIADVTASILPVYQSEFLVGNIRSNALYVNANGATWYSSPATAIDVISNTYTQLASETEYVIFLFTFNK